MAFSDFVQCCSKNGETLGDALVNLGERAVRSLLDAWRSLPLDARAAVVAAAEVGGVALAAALAAIGVEAAELVAVFLIGFGIGATIAIMVDCGDCL